MDVEEAIHLLDELHELRQTTPEKNLSKVLERLSKKVSSELKQLQRHNPGTKKKSVSNLPHLKGIFYVLRASKSVKQILCSMKRYGIVIDVISDSGRTWKKVVARNAQSTHLIWAGKGQYGNKDVTKILGRYVNASQEFCEVSPPKVVCVFCNGVTHEMAQYLEQMGVIVEGERVDVDSDTLRRLDTVSDLEDSDDESWESDFDENDLDEDNEQTEGSTGATNFSSDNDTMSAAAGKPQVFLDVTSMVILVSDVCNGGADFPFADPSMAEQAQMERTDPVSQMLAKIIDGKELYTCETAVSNFKSFMSMLGGEGEKRRAEDLLGRLNIVEDGMSDRFADLKVGGKVKLKLECLCEPRYCLILVKKTVLL